jgi:hypothetical protein
MAPKLSKTRPKQQERKAKRPRVGGTAVVYPRGLEEQLGVTSVTRWRMEYDGRLPARDFFIGGEAVGWRPSTLAAAFGPTQAATAA